jgi:hypothetical protein
MSAPHGQDGQDTQDTQDTHDAHAAAWWMTRVWRRFLTDLLLFRSRRRYTLTISTTALIGATDPERRHVEVNPIALALPHDPARLSCIRGLTQAMRRDTRVWQQAITIALVEHECGHVRFTGARPHQVLREAVARQQQEGD